MAFIINEKVIFLHTCACNNLESSAWVEDTLRTEKVNRNNTGLVELVRPDKGYTTE